MKNIRLIRPTLELKEKALEFRQEFFDNNEMIINGSELFDKTESYEEWIRSVTDNTDAKTVNPNWVVTDTFFAIDEANTVVGIIDLRHTLNDFLKDLGNCGYLDEIHISVERNNEPSIKTIIKNGGVYERSFEFEGEQADIYRIAL